jgi:hypothetical protein
VQDSSEGWNTDALKKYHNDDPRWYSDHCDVDLLPFPFTYPVFATEWLVFEYMYGSESLRQRLFVKARWIFEPLRLW